MIEVGKSYRTRDYELVRIYATGCGGEHPVHGAYFRDKRWIICAWTADGKHNDSALCLVADFFA